MKVAIVGSGYVGLVTGTCFAEVGIEVMCVDVIMCSTKVDTANFFLGMFTTARTGLCVESAVSLSISRGNVSKTGIFFSRIRIIFATIQSADA